jgi:pimeloyl-ACP methyl ester carboxylesterase/2-polyprenyl-6-methoxyphenol hydroxylase-like FAD-dependent oxidoreductase
MTPDPGPPRADAHAVVIGGSMAGLLAARVLADHFARVTLVERDRLADSDDLRKGVPQARHIHGLLAGGLDALGQLFPDLEQALVAGGAVLGDYVLNVSWNQFGRYRRRFASGIRGISLTRPFLEWQVRRRVLALPNLALRQECSVTGLLASPDRGRVLGVMLQDRARGAAEQLAADLVVDAGGRGSHAPQWLEQLGYRRPPEQVVKVGVGYASRMYERQPSPPDVALFTSFVLPLPPETRRAAGLFPVEGGRWQVTLSGYLGDHPPADEAGFLDFARSLPCQDIYRVISQARPLSDIGTYTYPASRRHRYDRMERFPEGYLVFGDAVCSFNPIYGQGMTVSAQSALALQALLCERPGVEGLARRFYRRAAPIVEAAWLQATGEDLRYPEAEGERPRGLGAQLWYTGQAQRAAMDDPHVCLALARVINLLEPPARLVGPDIALRTLAHAARPPALLGPPEAQRVSVEPSRIHRSADLGEVRLHYVELGRGPLVVLLHGFPEHWYSWRYQIPALAAAGFRVVAPDLRGYNTSSKPSGVDAYGIDRLAGDVAALIRHLGAERAHVVGHDWGAAVAWYFAMHHADLLDRLAIMNVPHPARFAQGIRSWRQLLRSWYIFFFQLPWLPEALMRAGGYALPRLIFRHDPRRPGAFEPHELERYVAALDQPGALTAMINYYRALVRQAPRRLGEPVPVIAAPTLVIWGLRDLALGPELAEPDRALVPNLRVERFPDASHWVQVDRPAEVNRLLLEFLGA